jgi:serine O-acetyltransferase
VACVAERDPAARSRLDVLTLYPGVQAIALHRIAHRLWHAGWPYAARLLAYLSRAVTHIEIHPAACIGARCFIDHGCGVVIGATAVLGDDVTLYHGVTLGGTSLSAGKRHPTVADGVVIGAGAKVLGNVTIGAGSRIAANAVVIDDVPAGVTVVGAPGRVVRQQRRPAAAGIDLDHHLMPDPVGQAIGSLLDRVLFLEARLAELRLGTHDSRTEQPFAPARGAPAARPSSPAPTTPGVPA